MTNEELQKWFDGIQAIVEEHIAKPQKTPVRNCFAFATIHLLKEIALRLPEPKVDGE